MRKMIWMMLLFVAAFSFATQASTYNHSASLDSLKKQKPKKVKKISKGQKQTRVNWNIKSNIETDARNWRRSEYFA